MEDDAGHDGRGGCDGRWGPRTGRTLDQRSTGGVGAVVGQAGDAIRLLDAWDVMGAARAIRPGTSEYGHPAHLLGSRAGRPEFAMLSLDSAVAVLGTAWESGISSLAVANRGDTGPVPRMINWAAAEAWDARVEREEALAWLRYDEPTVANQA
ncbi:hypothetical protein ACFVVU_14065 [Kitasatospora sp. NPDC057965]|uniref:hypothetical protein n=1 Tax=Kitasatospora sp. NPDC057965 TaxID=3346291 RepID=UPI0036DE3501